MACHSGNRHCAFSAIFLVQADHTNTPLPRQKDKTKRATHPSLGKDLIIDNGIIQALSPRSWARNAILSSMSRMLLVKNITNGGL